MLEIFGQLNDDEGNEEEVERIERPSKKAREEGVALSARERLCRSDAYPGGRGDTLESGFGLIGAIVGGGGGVAGRASP